MYLREAWEIGEWELACASIESLESAKIFKEREMDEETEWNYILWESQAKATGSIS